MSLAVLCRINLAPSRTMMHSSTRRQFNRPAIGLCLNLLLCLSTGPAAASEHSWPGFRGGGAARSLVHDDTLAKHWPKPPQPLWLQAQLGRGHGSISISKQHAYLIGNQAGKRSLYCVDLKTGSIRWTQFLGGKGAANSTPALAGAFIYTQLGGHLYCHRQNDGGLVWHQAILASVKAAKGQNQDAKMIYGSWNMSPLVTHGLVIIQTGISGKSVVALDSTDGRTRWIANTTPGVRYRGWSTPTVIKHHDQPMILATLHDHLLGLSPENGEVLWEQLAQSATPAEKILRGKSICNQPVYHAGRIYISSGYRGSENKSWPGFFTLSPDGRSLTADGKRRVICPMHEGMIHLDGKLYGFGKLDREDALANPKMLLNGEALPATLSKKFKAQGLICQDFNSQDILGIRTDLLEKRSAFSGPMLIGAGTRLYATWSWNTDHAWLLAADPSLAVCGQLTLPPEVPRRQGNAFVGYSAPALVDGVLYIRVHNVLVAYDVSSR